MASIVCERDDFKTIVKIDEDDVIRERVNWHSPNVRVVHMGNAAAYLRKLLDQLECPAGLCREPVSHTWVSFTVPVQSFVEIELRGLDNLDRLQRPRTSFSTRWRTVRQSVLSSSPARAAATRC